MNYNYYFKNEGCNTLEFNKISKILKKVYYRGE